MKKYKVGDYVAHNERANRITNLDQVYVIIEEGNDHRGFFCLCMKTGHSYQKDESYTTRINEMDFLHLLLNELSESLKFNMVANYMENL